MSTMRLRPDIEIFRSLDSKGVVCYLVRDPHTTEIIHFREEEMFLCEQMAEDVPFPEIQTRFQERFKAPLAFEHLASFVHVLGNKGLLAEHTAPIKSIWSLLRYQSPENWARWKIFDPQKMLDWLSKKLWWCYTLPFLVCAGALFVLALITLLFNFNAFRADVSLLVSPLNLFQIVGLMYVFISVPGELARGVTASRYRGRTDEFGIWLAYNIMPRFCCLTNAWEIPGKANRNLTLFTPSFYALLAGSIGILLWKIVPAHLVLHKFGITLACLAFIDSFVRLFLFWPNEAQFMLTNTLEQVNFRERAINAFQAWLFRRPLPEPLTRKERKIFISYGLLTSLATLPAFLVLAYFGGKLLIKNFAGTGGAILTGIVSIKYRKVISRCVRENAMGQWLHRLILSSKKRTRITVGVIIVLIILLFPYPYEAGGSFKILPMQRVELRAVVAGEIKKVMVKENETVKKDTPQAMLDQREHLKNYQSAKADYEKSVEDLKVMLKGPKPEEVKKAEEQVKQAKTQAEYSRKEEVRLKSLHKEGVIGFEEYEKAAGQADVDARSLDVFRANLALVKSGPRPEEIEAQRAVVRDREAKMVFFDQGLTNTILLAPINGKVVTPNVEFRVGQYLKEGDLFATYESAEEAQIEIQLPEADVPEIEMGNKVRFRLQAYPLHVFEGTVILIAYDALETPNGKVVRVKLKVPNDKNELKPEMTGAAKIDGGWKPVAVAFSRPIVRFVMVEIWSWFP